jgi:GxxExxY protein
MQYLYQYPTERIIKCFFKGYNTLGYGFLEKMYERAMMIELAEEGLSTRSQFPIEVYYKEQSVGDYSADIIVDEKIVLKLKAKPVKLAPHPPYPDKH